MKFKSQTLFQHLLLKIFNIWTKYGKRLWWKSPKKAPCAYYQCRLIALHWNSWLPFPSTGLYFWKTKPILPLIVSAAKHCSELSRPSVDVCWMNKWLNDCWSNKQEDKRALGHHLCILFLLAQMSMDRERDSKVCLLYFSLIAKKNMYFYNEELRYYYLNQMIANMGPSDTMSHLVWCTWHQSYNETLQEIQG